MSNTTKAIQAVKTSTTIKKVDLKAMANDVVKAKATKKVKATNSLTLGKYTFKAVTIAQDMQDKHKQLSSAVKAGIFIPNLTGDYIKLLNKQMLACLYVAYAVGDTGKQDLTFVNKASYKTGAFLSAYKTDGKGFTHDFTATLNIVYFKSALKGFTGASIKHSKWVKSTSNKLITLDKDILNLYIDVLKYTTGAKSKKDVINNLSKGFDILGDKNNSVAVKRVS